MLTQEGVVFGIVGACLLHLIWRGMGRRLLQGLSSLLLKKGRVSWAMRLRARVKAPQGRCGSCRCS
ncbi:hypothetical protein EBS43_00355 [bacterium]|nr:hypothetical protein [bacterium]